MTDQAAALEDLVPGCSGQEALANASAEYALRVHALMACGSDGEDSCVVNHWGNSRFLASWASVLVLVAEPDARKLPAHVIPASSKGVP